MSKTFKRLLEVLIVLAVVGAWLYLGKLGTLFGDWAAFLLPLIVILLYAWKINREKPNLKTPRLSSWILSLGVPGLGQAVLEKKWWKIPLFIFLIILGFSLIYASLYFLLSLGVPKIINGIVFNLGLMLIVGVPVINLLDADQTGKRYSPERHKEPNRKTSLKKT